MNKVNLKYEISTNRGAVLRKLPFVIAVLADLSGKPLSPLHRLKDRRFVQYDFDSFEQCLSCVQPRLAFKIDNFLIEDQEVQLSIELTFNSLNDFSPDSVVKQVYPLRALQKTRAELAALLGKNPSHAAINAMRNLDTLISRQLNAIMHYPDFVRLEETWRGLYYLVSKVKLDEEVQILVLNVSKKELLKDFKKAVEFDQCAIFKKIYDEEFGTSGGNPISLVVGDYFVENHLEDMILLEEMSHVCAAACSVFVTSVKPQMYFLDTWSNFNRDVNIDWFSKCTLHNKFRELCESEDAYSLMLTMPRLRARQFYSSSELQTKSFNFQEEWSNDCSEQGVWFNAAYAFAALAAHRFRESAWLAPLGGEQFGKVPDVNEETPEMNGQKNPPIEPEFEIDESTAEKLGLMGVNATVTSSHKGIVYFPKLYSLSDWWSYQSHKKAARPTVEMQLCINRIFHYMKNFMRDCTSHLPFRNRCEKFTAWLNQYTQSGSNIVNNSSQKLISNVEIEYKDYTFKHSEAIIYKGTLAYRFEPPYPQFTIRYYNHNPYSIAHEPTYRQPYRILVIGDFCGLSTEPFPKFLERKFVQVAQDNFNNMLADHFKNFEMQIQHISSITEDVFVQMNLKSLQDFTPELLSQLLAEQIKPLSNLLNDRSALIDLAWYAEIDLERSRALEHFAVLPEGMDTLLELNKAYEEKVNTDDLVELKIVSEAMKGWRRNHFMSTERHNEILQTFAKWLKESPDLIRESWLESLKSILRKMDAQISKVLNAVLRNPQFRKLESRWLGLEKLVKATKNDESVEVHMLSLTRDELQLNIKYNRLENKIKDYFLDDNMDIHCLIVDFDFGLNLMDISILKDFIEMAHDMNIHVLVSASPEFLGLTSWVKGADRAITNNWFESEKFISWQNFCKHPHALNLSVVFPPFRARKPYKLPSNLALLGFSEAQEETDDFPLLSSNSYPLAAEMALIHNLHDTSSSHHKRHLKTLTEVEKEIVDLIIPDTCALIEKLDPELRNLGLIWPVRLEPFFFTEHPVTQDKKTDNGSVK